jgi:hypothetical protein
MTTPHVHCLSHLPSAHEAEWRSSEGEVSDENPAAPANGPLGHRSKINVGPLSASLPRSATCLVPMLR